MSNTVSAGLFPDQTTRGFLHVLLGQGIAAPGHRTLWDTLRGRWARSHASASSHATPAGGADQQVSFRTWSECVQQLLGPTDSDPAAWPTLYARGATPLEAARWAVLGGGDRWTMAGRATDGEL